MGKFNFLKCIQLHANQNFVSKSPLFFDNNNNNNNKIDITPNMYIIHQKKFIFLGNKGTQDFQPSQTLNFMALYAIIDEE